ncbi:protein phosphatase 1 regulatory subunit 12A isoform X8 [Drosophila pseudoobscura]|uniref:Protein phosphatase 1 regulatory subunit 12B n=1 Tax=Drosophila pseudoobscura pseudoobscura TaxID=46245 RepID=A0A6I8W7S9_DROPS|nr:protein phosphatase 1 regulatory subunit 12A isoform X8 [Drosophila pseudoobscura]
MSTLDARNNSAMMKRAEQLKRWEESDTNRAAPTPRHEHGRRIKFSSGCVFLAACLSGDKDEVIQLLDQGADINTANVDGLTALHQACIDDNLHMVEFLVKRGADINRQDNEGWTPLHATASCGFVSIARYLVENGADVAAVNSDGDLALDLAIDVQHRGMIEYMEKIVQELNIDVEQARKAEEEAMLSDAERWLSSDAAEVDRPHPKTGATALHVAAAKGYTNVLSLLLEGRGNVDRQDNDGWTPLHAASHWGQQETSRMLVESLADMDIRNYAGQSCIDVADRKIVKFLEELRAKNRNQRRPSSQIRISDAIENRVDKTPTKLVRVEVRTDATKDAASSSNCASSSEASLPIDNDNDDIDDDDDNDDDDDAVAHESDAEELSDSTESSHTTSLSGESEAENVKPNQQQIHALEHPVEEEAPWRRKMARAPNDSPTNNQVPDRELSSNSSESANDVILRRTQSFENDEKKPTVTHVGTPTGTAATAKTTLLSSPSTNALTPPIRSQVTAKTTAQSNNGSSSTASASASASASDVETAKPPPKQSTGNIIKNFFKSFVPPVRDEESETQRKAHAKRVRETRRSTQGVTLDEIKSAEELVKKKNMGMANNNNNNNNNISSSGSNDTSETAAATATSEHTSSISDASQQEPQPPPPPTTPPPAIIPTSDETEIETILAPSPVQSANDTTASFTLSAPSRRSVVVDDDDDGDGDGDGKAGGDADDPEAVVSASYTIVSRRDKIPDSAESEPEQVESNKQKTDEQQAESEEQKARPTDLPLSAAPTEAIKSSSSTTPGSLESPVRLRDKRGLSGSSQETDTKSDTASPVSAHPDFNARDSLLSLYARRTTDGSGGASAAAAAAAATATGGAGTGAGGAGGSSTSTSTAERRPSWRLKFDAGSKFKLEDNTSGGTYPPNNSTIIPSAPAVMAAANLSTTTGIQRRISSGPNALNASNQSLNSVGRPISAPSESTNNSSAYATPAVRKYETTSTGAGTGVGARVGAAATTTATTTANSVSATSANHAAGTAATTNATSSHDDKENDKENDNRTQTVIQRRRKPKRRSTGVVHLDVDELDPERQNEEKDKESGSERTSRSRLGSTTSTAATSTTRSESKGSSDKSENGDGIDYKALWEAAKLENDKLKQVLKQKDDEVVQTRATLERFANATTKNSLSEIEKRERRAMERKLSELEEELKLLQKLKTENDRLRAENRALTRVVSKLTTSAQSQLAKAK